MIELFKNDDHGYANWVRNNPNGFVYNDFRGSNPEYRKVHLSSCATLRDAGYEGKRTNVRKVCSSNLPELLDWLRKSRGIRGKGYTACQDCNPF